LAFSALGAPPAVRDWRDRGRGRGSKRKSGGEITRRANRGGDTLKDRKWEDARRRTVLPHQWGLAQHQAPKRSRKPHEKGIKPKKKKKKKAIHEVPVQKVCNLFDDSKTGLDYGERGIGGPTKRRGGG